MEKKKVIPIIVAVVLLIGIVGVVFYSYNNKVVSTITLDINPSVELNLTRNGKVKNVVALNEDAKEIVSNSLNGKSLDDVIESITDKVVELGYADEGTVTILVSSDNKVINNTINEKVTKNFEEKRVQAFVIVVENITEEDKELAKKYNITPAKASYINSISKDIEEVNINDLIDKPVNELEETKKTGNYCEPGYSLEGDVCYKKIGEETPVDGSVCPRNTIEYNGKCYEEVGSVETENYECNEDFNLVGTECLRNHEVEAIPSKYTCSKGEAKTRLEAGLTGAGDGDAKDIVCVDLSNATHPVSPCELNDGTEWTKSGGKCYWHRAPVIADGCPGKIQVGGMCWDDASNVLICAGERDGKRYSSRSEYCEKSVKYTDPTVTEYKCEDENATLNGKKCIIKEIEEAHRERTCPSGYTMTENRCLKIDSPIEKEKGLECLSKDSRLVGNICYLYETMGAYHN